MKRSLHVHFVYARDAICIFKVKVSQIVVHCFKRTPATYVLDFATSSFCFALVFINGDIYLLMLGTISTGLGIKLFKH